MKTIIELKDVTRRFGDFIAVNQLNLQVQQGEIFGLLGPNGAGKTTTVKMITGLLSHSSGKLLVAGYDPVKEARQVRQRIGLVPQDTNVYSDLSALNNLWHHAGLYCRDLNRTAEHIEELLKIMNLYDRRMDPLRTYSGGMKRRLALARALLHDPQIILFDEPTLGVDVQGKHSLLDHIKTLKGQGKTFIITTNDMNEADQLCDRLAIIDHGICIVVGTPEDLKSSLQHDIVTLRTTPPVQRPQEVFKEYGAGSLVVPEPGMVRFEVQNAESILVELIASVSAEHHLESFKIARPNLDDVFLHYTGRGLRE